MEIKRELKTAINTAMMKLVLSNKPENPINNGEYGDLLNKFKIVLDYSIELDRPLNEMMHTLSELSGKLIMSITAQQKTDFDFSAFRLGVASKDDIYNNYKSFKKLIGREHIFILPTILEMHYEIITELSSVILTRLNVSGKERIEDYIAIINSNFSKMFFNQYNEHECTFNFDWTKNMNYLYHERTFQDYFRHYRVKITEGLPAEFIKVFDYSYLPKYRVLLSQSLTDNPLIRGDKITHTEEKVSVDPLA